MKQSNFSVILAEDEQLLLDNMAEKINTLDLGFSVIGKAQTGIQAYELVKENPPDLLITDIKMPVMNGIDLLKKVYTYYPFIKFIIVSGYSDFEYTKSAIRLEVSGYLLKPIDKEELKEELIKVRQKLLLEQKTYDKIFSPQMSIQTPKQIASSIKEYLVAHYNEYLNLNLIANSMNYSSGYLTKIFLQQYDTTPSKYITELRISKAKYFLAHSPSLSIRQIGEIVGYDDQGYFSRIFKKKVGISPFEYRDGR